MNQFKNVCAVFLALCLILICGILAYAEMTPQNVQTEEPAEAVIDEVTENEEYTESRVCFTDDDMLILPRPVKEGKIFIEWNTKEDGNGQGYQPGEIVDPENIKLYAIWAEEEAPGDEMSVIEIPDAKIPEDETVIAEATVSEAGNDEKPQKGITETEDETIRNGEMED